MITSKDNSKIKLARALQADSKTRRAEGAFVVEGIRLVEEALISKWEITWAVYTDELGERGRVLIQDMIDRGISVEQVTSRIMHSASDTQTPQGVLAVVQNRSTPLPSKLDFVLIVDELRDPGNLGTMLRTASAAGVGAVLLSAGSVDPFSPKVLRSAMGAHFRLPIDTLAWDQIRMEISKHGLAAYLATADAGQPFTQLDFRCPTALIIGGEAAGASIQAQQVAMDRVYIPMPGGGESLNAAVAAAILMYEVVRQRKLQ
jgi:TrmH family RNA methyltransferase